MVSVESNVESNNKFSCLNIHVLNRKDFCATVEMCTNVTRVDVSGGEKRCT